MTRTGDLREDDTVITPLDPERSATSPFHSQGMMITHPTKMIFVAGQVGVTADGRVGNGVAEQTQIAFANVHAVLAEGGVGPKSILKHTIYLTDDAHIAAFVEAGREWLPDPRPAATLLIVGQLANPDLLVQIEAVAAA